jgi:hypothetical protein
MTLRNRLILASVCTLAAAVPQLPAQNNKAELSGGYVYANVNPEAPLPKAGFNGWVGSVNGYPIRRIGIGGEISAVFGDIGKEVATPGVHAKEYSYLFGPTFKFVDTAKSGAGVKVLLGGAFAQARFASATTATQIQAFAAKGYSPFDQTKFAMLIAVPVDYYISKSVGVRVEPGMYFTDFNYTKQWNFRLSVGPVFRFGAR